MSNNEIKFSEYTQSLYKGEHIDGLGMRPETLPLFATTAFNPRTLTEVRDVYDNDGYRYIRGKTQIEMPWRKP